jgi:hypothetical protein
MGQNCYGCRFAIEARNHPRHGEQVRCAKAEEMFGLVKGKDPRWVDVRRSEKTRKLLKPKCGQFQDFIGDNSRAPDPEKPARKVVRKCPSCQGSGRVLIQFVSGTEAMKCHKCKGEGKIPVDGS